MIQGVLLLTLNLTFFSYIKKNQQLMDESISILDFFFHESVLNSQDLSYLRSNPVCWNSSCNMITHVISFRVYHFDIPQMRLLSCGNHGRQGSDVSQERIYREK